MEDKNDWITQGIKISCKHKRSLYAFTKNSSDPKAKAYHIKHCKIIRKVIKEAMQQHYSRLTAKSSNEIKTIQNIIRKETKKVYSVKWVPTLLVNDEKFKDPTDVANAFNNFFIIVTEKLNIQQRKERLSQFLNINFLEISLT